MYWIIALFALVLIGGIFMCILTVGGRVDDRMEQWTSTLDTCESPQLYLLSDPSPIIPIPDLRRSASG